MSLSVESLSVDYGDRRVLDNVSFDVATATTLAVVGPSGSGKSTMLRAISGIVEPTLGRVLVDGEDVTTMPTHLRRIGMVFQDNQLFAHMSVADNVSFGLTSSHHRRRRERTRATSRAQRADRVAELLDIVGLSGFESRRPASLSGGEAKRVALARALAPAPRVLLLDEPLTGLDRPLHDRLMGDLRAILEKSSITAVLVTHDETEATSLATGILRLSPHGHVADTSR